MLITLAYFVLVVISTVIYQVMQPKDSASTTEERIETPKSFKTFYIYLLLSSAFAIVVFPNWTSPIFLQLYQSVETGWTGLVIAMVGMALFVWAMVHLSAHYSPCYDAKLPSQIVSTGPYAMIRHPVYTANLLLILGVAVSTGSVWTMLNFIGLFAFYIHCAKIEEKALAQRFESYEYYLGQTGRFVPRLAIHR